MSHLKKPIINQLFFVEWVDSSKRRNDAENLTLLNKSFDVISAFPSFSYYDGNQG